MSKATALRLFLDSNVLTGGIIAEWGLDKAVWSLCAARICHLALAEVICRVVEHNLVTRALSFSKAEAEQVLADYVKLIKLARPEIIPLLPAAEVARSRHIIRHAADVPVLLSAILSQPDWLLTHNTKHFTPAVAKRASLRIATPTRFFKTLAASLPS